MKVLTAMVQWMKGDKHDDDGSSGGRNLTRFIRNRHPYQSRNIIKLPISTHLYNNGQGLPGVEKMMSLLPILSLMYPCENTLPSTKMAIFLPRIIQAKRVLRRSFSNGSSTSTSMDIPKGYFAVYVGEEEKRRFVVPVSLLSQLEFQEFLHLAEEQFGYDHPMGGLTIPCSEDLFIDLASRFDAL
ncbi:hypothetical protein E3N88_08620 [Mikania micrantha]|uniref:Uncharacterized protein n=1 Tax=Mikania micrantha TaxID=192012 RepID=A0A5N6PGT0_9ASTR|nr:hypothetical protein E3N88_08620 [Mikania micrantha]